MFFINNNKKTIFILIGVIILISILLIVLLSKKTTEITCTINEKEDIYTMDIEINILLEDRIVNYKKSNVYQYKKGYKDELVDKYDNVKKYFNYLDKNIDIKTNLVEEEYILKYDYEVNIDKIDKDNYKLVEIEDIIKLKEKKDIIKYYEKQGYTCK